MINTTIKKLESRSSLGGDARPNLRKNALRSMTASPRAVSQTIAVKSAPSETALDLQKSRAFILRNFWTKSLVSDNIPPTSGGIRCERDSAPILAGAELGQKHTTCKDSTQTRELCR